MQVFIRTVTIFALLVIGVYSYFRYIEGNREGTMKNDLSNFSLLAPKEPVKPIQIEFGFLNDKTVILNGNELYLSEKPYIDQGVLMVPIQEIILSTGGWLSFDREKGVFSVEFAGKNINGYLNSDYIFIGNQRLYLLKEPVLKNQKIYVPIDFFSTGLNFEAKKEKDVIRMTFHSNK